MLLILSYVYVLDTQVASLGARLASPTSTGCARRLYTTLRPIALGKSEMYAV